MAISASAISASTEVRQYGLLLCFVCGALYATQRAVSEGSTRYAIVQGLFLVGAVLTHYTARGDNRSRHICLALLVFRRRSTANSVHDHRNLNCRRDSFRVELFCTVSPRGGVQCDQPRLCQTVILGERYRDAAWILEEGVLGNFLIYGQREIGVSLHVSFPGLDLPPCCLAGPKHRALLALLIISPLLLGFATAVCQVLPFAGSRHQTYLLPFLAVGFSAALTWMPRTWMAPLLLLGVVLAPHWLTHNPPDNNPRILPIRDMTAATNYIQQAVPRGSPLFVDEQTRYLLGYYLGRNDSSLDSQRPLRSNERIDGRRIVAPRGYVWSFNPKETFPQLNDSAGTLGLVPTEPLWVVSAAWARDSTRNTASGRGPS